MAASSSGLASMASWLLLPAIAMAVSVRGGRPLDASVNLIADDSTFLTKMEEIAGNTWNHMFADGAVHVLEGSAGVFRPTDSCPTPRLWVFISGHYRTFNHVQENLAQMASLSSSNCYMVVAVMPRDICVRKPDPEHHQCAAADGSLFLNPNAPELDYNDLPTAWHSVDTTAHLLRTAQTSVFGGRLAWLTLEMTGRYDSYPHWIEPQRHLLSSVAEASAAVHGFEPDPISLVAVTRPDTLFTVAFDISGTRKLFAGKHGTRYLLGQDGAPATDASEVAVSESLMFTSYYAYKTHIALPLAKAEALHAEGDRTDYEYDMQELAERNVLGSGFSQEGPLPSGEACACVEESDDQSGHCLTAESHSKCTACVMESCLLIVLESYVSPSSALVQLPPTTPFPAVGGSDPKERFDLTAAVHPYAPYTLSQPENYSFVSSTYGKKLLRPWIDASGLGVGDAWHNFYRLEPSMDAVQPNGMDLYYSLPLSFQDAYTGASRPYAEDHVVAAGYPSPSFPPPPPAMPPAPASFADRFAPARAAAEALRAEDLVKEAKAAEGDAARLANEAKEKGTPEEAQKAGAAKEAATAKVIELQKLSDLAAAEAKKYNSSAPSPWYMSKASRSDDNSTANATSGGVANNSANNTGSEAASAASSGPASSASGTQQGSQLAGYHYVRRHSSISRSLATPLDDAKRNEMELRRKARADARRRRRGMASAR